MKKGNMKEKNLFDLFPDLPFPARRPVGERVLEVRLRADEARRQAQARSRAWKAMAERIASEWRKARRS